MVLLETIHKKGIFKHFLSGRSIYHPPLNLFELTFFNILTNITNTNNHICGRESRRAVFPYTGILIYELILSDP